MADSNLKTTLMAGAGLGLVGIIVTRVWFAWPLRQQLFIAVFIIGLTLLWWVRRDEGAVSATAERSIPKAAPAAKVMPPGSTTVERLLAEDGVLSEDKARAWLDEFLIEQQK